MTLSWQFSAYVASGFFSDASGTPWQGPATRKAGNPWDHHVVMVPSPKKNSRKRGLLIQAWHYKTISSLFMIYIEEDWFMSFFLIFFLSSDCSASIGWNMLKPTVTRKPYQNSIVSGFLVSLPNWKMNLLNHCQSGHVWPGGRGLTLGRAADAWVHPCSEQIGDGSKPITAIFWE